MTSNAIFNFELLSGKQYILIAEHKSGRMAEYSAISPEDLINQFDRDYSRDGWEMNIYSKNTAFTREIQYEWKV